MLYLVILQNNSKYKFVFIEICQLTVPFSPKPKARHFLIHFLQLAYLELMKKNVRTSDEVETHGGPISI